jgi:hypothetical protein
LKIGHTANNCWDHFKEDYVPEPHTAAAATSGTSVDNSWYTDSGGTHHITGYLDRLTIHDHYAGADQVHPTNGKGMTISRIGKTVIPNPC